MWVNLLATREWNVEAELLREESRFATQYHLYKLKDLVEIVSIPAAELPRDEYKQVTVRKNQHDVILRDRVLAKDIKDIKRQSIVRAGQMIVSRINAKDGAIGIVPQELDGAIVSDNFIVLNFKSNSVDPYYMLMLLTSERYRKMLKGISRGVTARSYIRNIDFLEMEVPVPDMEKQLELIGDMAGIQQKINKLEKQWTDGVKRFSKELFGQ
jgi:type I restriction enzyme S subunit